MNIGKKVLAIFMANILMFSTISFSWADTETPVCTDPQNNEEIKEEKQQPIPQKYKQS